MNLKFKANQQEKKITVSLSRESEISFSLNENNNVNNETIVEFLGKLAREIASNNITSEKDFEIPKKEELGELEALFNFVHSLFISFIKKFNEESENFKQELENEISNKESAIKDAI